MNLEEYERVGSGNCNKACNICAKAKVGEFHNYRHIETGAMIWVCRDCQMTKAGLEKTRIQIKPVEMMDRTELVQTMNSMLNKSSKWINFDDSDLRELVEAIRGGIYHAIRETENFLQHNQDEHDLGLVSGEAFIIRWKQATKHLTRMPEAIRYAVADAIIRDLGGYPPERPPRKGADVE